MRPDGMLNFDIYHVMVLIYPEAQREGPLAEIAVGQHPTSVTLAQGANV